MIQTNLSKSVLLLAVSRFQDVTEKSGCCWEIGTCGLCDWKSGCWNGNGNVVKRHLQGMRTADCSVPLPVVWGGWSDALKKWLNSLLRRSGKLILPDKNLTTDQKLNKIGILNFHKQLDYNKGVFMYRALTNSAPVYISSLYKAPHSSSRNNYLQLPKPRIDLFKTSMAFSGALFWNSFPVHLRSCHSLSSFKRNLREHLNTTI